MLEPGEEAVVIIRAAVMDDGAQPREAHLGFRHSLETDSALQRGYVASTRRFGNEAPANSEVWLGLEILVSWTHSTWDSHGKERGLGQRSAQNAIIMHPQWSPNLTPPRHSQWGLCPQLSHWASFLGGSLLECAHGRETHVCFAN